MRLWLVVIAGFVTALAAMPIPEETADNRHHSNLDKPALVGGFKRTSHQKDPHIQELAQVALQLLSSKVNEQLDLVKIQSVDSQVVAGMNYVFILEVVQRAQSVKQTYEVHLYEPLGQQPKQLTSHKLLPKDDASARQAAEASSERHSGAVLGGYKEVDASSPEVQHVVQYAVGELAQQSNSLVPPKLEEVVKARSKVEGGVLYELELKLTTGVVKVTVMQGIGNHMSLVSQESLA